MKLVALLIATVSLLVLAPETAAQRVSAELQDGFVSWDLGEYEAALRHYLRVLDGPEGDRLKNEIASLTGERFPVTEVSLAGQEIGVSPDGLFASFRHTLDGVESISIVSLEGEPRVVDTFSGTELTFGPGGRIAYLSVPPSPELDQARDALGAARDRQSFVEARSRIAWIQASSATLHLGQVGAEGEREIPLGGLVPISIEFSVDGETLYLAAGSPDGRANDIYAIQAFRLQPEPILTGPGYKAAPQALGGGRYLVYARPAEDPVPRAPGVEPGPEGVGGFVLVDLEQDQIFHFAGRGHVVAADGRTLAFLTGDEVETAIEVVDLDPLVAVPGEAMRSTRVVLRTEDPIDNLTLSTDGRWIAYQRRPAADWEIFAIRADGSGEERRITREIQHDLFPTFINERVILAVKGEARHRRSFLYDIEAGTVTKLFHNNTVRTIAPEYEWVVSPDGSRVIIVSERDGDTVSPERGVYVVDLTHTVSKAAVRDRLVTNLESEQRLAEKGRRMFAPIEGEVASVADAVSVSRIFGYESDLFAFDSKFITEPGNREAILYLTRTLESFGYVVEQQWFDPRPGVPSANVIVRLTGTVDPELVCTVSSHFDSVLRGPGADDDTSGTAALLDVARVLAGRNLPISVEFAFFTGEEAGLLGSREYVRRAQGDEKQIVCALNNDMIGWAESHRLDNTIRYSNEGIRDVQHAAAALFSNLITYDAKYYKNTDAHAYYEVYGDIVGGIGSYPVLGNPNYHQASDRLETINHQLVAEVSRTTVATIMLLASSPARLTGVITHELLVGIEVAWDPARESDVEMYRVRYVATDGERRTREFTFAAGAPLRAVLGDAAPGTTVEVKAVNRRGLDGWDWARPEGG